MVPTLTDWRNSLTFPVSFSIFQYFLFCFKTENLIHFNKLYTFHLNITKIINNVCLNFPNFSSFLFVPDFSSLFKIPTFPWLENAFLFFPSFPVQMEPSYHNHQKVSVVKLTSVLRVRSVVPSILMRFLKIDPRIGPLISEPPTRTLTCKVRKYIWELSGYYFTYTYIYPEIN